MIVFVSTAQHAYTHQSVIQAAAGVEVRMLSYDELLDARGLSRGTYVFTDADRLAPWAVRAAAQVCGRLRQAGVRVLNDPARLASRWGLLRSLYRRGINRFDAYRLEEGVLPRRWPVFLGVEGDHSFPVSDLLHMPEALERAIERAISAGVPRACLVVAEYAAEPIRPGIFRKLSVFRIGARTFGYTCVHQDTWQAKYGTTGLATPELYREELHMVNNNPYGEALMPAFALACIDYGRADFGIVKGVPQIYEINTNPNVEFGRSADSPIRRESYRVFEANYLAALRELDAS